MRRLVKDNSRDYYKVYGWIGITPVPKSATAVDQSISPRIREFMRFIYLLNIGEVGK